MREYWVVRRERTEFNGITFNPYDYWNGKGVRGPMFKPLGHAATFREKELLKAAWFAGPYYSRGPVEDHSAMWNWSWYKLTQAGIEYHLRRRVRILFSLSTATPLGIVADRYRDAGMDGEADDCMELARIEERRRKAEAVTESLRRVNKKTEAMWLIVNMQRRIAELERGL